MDQPEEKRARWRLRDSAPIAALRRRLHAQALAPWRNLTRPAYASFADARRALASTPPTAVRDEPTPVEVHDYPALFWMREVLERGGTVLDLRGGTGAQYYAHRRVLAYPASLRWIVVEEPAVVAQGRALAIERAATHLEFRDDVATVAADVLYSSRLAFVEEPLAALLAPLSPRPALVVLSQLPVSDAPTHVTLHRTARGLEPRWQFQRAAMTASLAQLGYRRRDEWRCVEPRARVPTSDRPEHIGLCFTRG